MFVLLKFLLVQADQRLISRVAYLFYYTGKKIQNYKTFVET